MNKNIKLFENQKKSVYKLMKETGVSCSTIYYYTSKGGKIEDMGLGLAKRIADAEGISLDTFYKNVKAYEFKKEYKDKEVEI